MGNRSGDIRSVTSQEKRLTALQLRRAGATYEAIAKHLGCSRQYATRAVHDAIADIPREEAVAVRELELQRCDALHMGLWASASKGHPQSVDSILRVMARRAKLLGLDAPVKQELTGKDGGPIETTGGHDDLLSRIARIAAAVATGSGNPDSKP